MTNKKETKWLDDTEKRLILEWRKRGFKIKYMAELLDRHFSSVSRYVKKMNVKVPLFKPTTKLYLRSPVDDTEKRLIALWRKRGLTNPVIAKLLDRQMPTVKSHVYGRYVKKINVKLPSRRNNYKRKRIVATIRGLLKTLASSL